MNVYIFSNFGLVYSYEDASTLREKYRIVGSLVGCLPHKPRQNVHLGLPLQLLPEEVTLLNDLGVVRLMSGNKPINEPSESELQAHNTHAEQVYQEQVKACARDRKAAIERQKYNIIEGKRAKRRKLGLDSSKETSECCKDTGHSDEESFDENEILEDIPITPLSRASAHVQIPTESQRKSKTDTTIATWDFPWTEVEKLRYRVFKDLWEQGYFLTGGVKFGGDYLVYPGDPARYHSFYIAVCRGHSEALSALQLASMGRLAATVKKTMLLCSVDASDKLSYLSINWPHIS